MKFQVLYLTDIYNVFHIKSVGNNPWSSLSRITQTGLSQKIPRFIIFFHHCEQVFIIIFMHEL